MYVYISIGDFSNFKMHQVKKILCDLQNNTVAMLYYGYLFTGSSFSVCSVCSLL